MAMTMTSRFFCVLKVHYVVLGKTFSIRTLFSSARLFSNGGKKVCVITPSTLSLKFFSEIVSLSMKMLIILAVQEPL